MGREWRPAKGLGSLVEGTGILQSEMENLDLELVRFGEGL